MKKQTVPPMPFGVERTAEGWKLTDLTTDDMAAAANGGMDGLISALERNIAPASLPTRRPSALRAQLNPEPVDPHSIINRLRKPAWLKGLALTDEGLYRRFYRQNRTSFAGAGYGAICGASTLSTLSSIRLHLSALEFALERPALRLLTVASHRVFWPPAQARPGWHRGHAVRSLVAIRLALRQWPLAYEPGVLR